MAFGKSGKPAKSLDSALKDPSGLPPGGDAPPKRRNYTVWLIGGFVVIWLGVTLLDYVDFDRTPATDQRDVYARREDCEQDWGPDPDKCEPVRSGEHVGHFYGPYYLPRIGGMGGYSGGRTFPNAGPYDAGSAGPGAPGGTVTGSSGFAPQTTGPARSLDEAMARNRMASAGASSAAARGSSIAGGSSSTGSSGLSASHAGSHAMGSVHVSRGGFGGFASHFSSRGG